MGEQQGSSDALRLAEVEARLDGLLTVVDRQQGEIARLQAKLEQARLPDIPARPVASGPGATGGAATTAAADPEPVDRTIGRRRLLLGGATAAAATAAAVVGTANPAAAANGDALTLGVTNTATAGTKLQSSAPDNDSGLWVQHTGTGSAIYADGNIGVSGATIDGYGVFGSAANGFGVVGLSDTNDAVHAQSNTGNGIYSISYENVGILGEGEITGVRGNAVNGEGVVGHSTNSAGVYGSSEAASALYGEANTGPGLTTISLYANLALAGDPSRLAPTSDSVEHFAGDVVTDKDGNQWVCVAGGTPGTWRKTAGPAAAGALHVLPVPVRIYDTRTGTNPSQGPKTPFAAGQTRVLDCKVNNSGVPAGATAVAATVLLVNAANSNGNFTIWANGKPKPSSNTLVWGGSTGRFTTSALTALDAAAKIQVNASAPTDLVIDIVGYYL